MRKSFLVISVAAVLMIISSPAAYAVQPLFYFDLNLNASVTDQGDGTWLYAYTLSGAPAPGSNYQLKDLSHWWIELPEEKIETLSDFDPFEENGEGEVTNPETYFNEPVGPYAGFHHGVKWDFSDLTTYSFVSTHGPVLDENGEVDQDAYLWFAKDGKINGVDAYDLGRTLGPNGGGNHEEPAPVPEPATLWLLGTGLASRMLIRKRNL